MKPDRYEVRWRYVSNAQVVHTRRFKTNEEMQSFVDKHRAIGYVQSKRNARAGKLKRLRRASEWAWYTQVSLF